MKVLSNSVLRVLIRLSYFMPLIVLATILIHFAVPHVFFLLNDEIYETMNTFTLMGNTWTECRTMTDTATQGSTDVFSQHSDVRPLGARHFDR